MILLINTTTQKTIKMNPIDVKTGSFDEYSTDSNAKDAKFKIGNHVRISKYKNIFAKGHAPNWSEEDFAIVELRLKK